MFKNTLARRAVADSGLDGVAAMFEGPVAIAFVRGDAGERGEGAARLRARQPGARAEGRSARDAGDHARRDRGTRRTPSRDVLLAQVAGGFQAPLIKAAGLFQAFTRNFAYGIKALIDQRGGVPDEPRRRGRRRPNRAEAVTNARDRSVARGPRRRQTPSAGIRRDRPEPESASPSNRRTSDMATMTTDDCSTSSRT